MRTARNLLAAEPDDTPDLYLDDLVPPWVKEVAERVTGKPGGMLLLARLGEVDVHDEAVREEFVARSYRLAPAPPQTQTSVVYFIRCGTYIKIGTTNTGADRRLRSMQLPPNAEVVAVMPGHGAATEHELHDRFRASRCGSGEWFTSSPELEALIEAYARHP